MLSVHLAAAGFSPPLAHAGHWFFWAIYLVPVFIVLGAAAQTVRVNRREQAELDRQPESEDGGGPDPRGP